MKSLMYQCISLIKSLNHLYDLKLQLLINSKCNNFDNTYFSIEDI